MPVTGNQTRARRNPVLGTVGVLGVGVQLCSVGAGSQEMNFKYVPMKYEEKEKTVFSNKNRVFEY